MEYINVAFAIFGALGLIALVLASIADTLRAILKELRKQN